MVTSETAKRRNGETARKPIRHFRDLEVYQNALATGLRAFELSKQFPPEERYSPTDQIRRSSRSVCANIAEAWLAVSPTPRFAVSFFPFLVSPIRSH
jgi:hypothetical protein